MITSTELRKFLSETFPGRERLPDDQDSLTNLTYNVNLYNLSIKDLEDYWENVKDIFDTIEKQFITALDQHYNYPTKTPFLWREDGALSTILELNNDNYWNEHKHYQPSQLASIIEEGRVRLRQLAHSH